MNKNFWFKGTSALSCLYILMGTAAFSHAGQTIYQMKDSNGVTLLTNNKGRYSNLKVEKRPITRTVTFIAIATGAQVRLRYCRAIAKTKMPLIQLSVRLHKSTVFLKV